MNKLITSVLVVVTCISLSHARKNPYMVFGTDEYKGVTEKIIGTWDVSRYNRGDRGEQIPSIYKKASIEFVRMSRDGKRGNIVWKFYLSDSLVQARSDDDREKDPSLKIDTYALVFKGKWDVYKKDPKLIRLSNDSEPELEIIGSGETFADFLTGQNALLKSSGAIGGAVGGAAGFIVKKSIQAKSGFNDITAKLPYQIEYTLDDTKIDLKGNGDLLFLGTKH